ncbi:MAG: PEP-CTERM sorting domain-containing protein [Pirellulales bacterium]
MIVRLTVVEVPEPTTLALAVAGVLPVAGFVLRRRRRCTPPA